MKNVWKESKSISSGDSSQNTDKGGKSWIVGKKEVIDEPVDQRIV